MVIAPQLQIFNRAPKLFRKVVKTIRNCQKVAGRVIVTTKLQLRQLLTEPKEKNISIHKGAT